MKTLYLPQLLLRNLVYWVLVLLSTTFFTSCLLLSAPLPRRRRHVFGQMWARFLTWSLATVVGLKYQVVGRENIPSVPSIICAKHQSGWETMALQAIFPAQIYVAKRELLWIPIFGWGFGMMNPITIDRKNATRSTQQIVRQGRERKSHGFWITVFPEGTRIAPGERGKYKLGAARMSKMLDMPLVPVAHNAGEFWPRNAFLKHPGLITVVIGAAVSAEQYPSADQQMAQVEEWIEARQDEIGGVGPCAPQSLRERRAHSEPA